jgi:hypothetical protein
MGGSFHEGNFHGGRDIAMNGAPDFPSFKEQHQNLKRTKKNISYMIGFTF